MVAGQPELDPFHCNGALREASINLYRKYHSHLLSFCEQMGIDEDKDVKDALKKFISMEINSAPLVVMNNWLKNTVAIINKKMTGSHSLIGFVIAYIHKNYNKNLSLTEVGDFFNVNSSYLSRKFSKEIGKGFSCYLTELRINKALNIMKNGNFKIYEIAERVGMMNTESFSRSFKKITGVSPSKYYK